MAVCVSLWCITTKQIPSWSKLYNLDDRSIFEAYKELFETLEAKGYKPKMNVMDNQATKYIKKFSPQRVRLAGGQTAQPSG